jgi:hypothetical protein
MMRICFERLPAGELGVERLARLQVAKAGLT